MNADTEKQCLDEIDHLILDDDKKVTLKYISDNWNIPYKDGEIVLEKWLKNYSGDRKIAKEYLIRGVHNGNAIIMVIPEMAISKVEQICSNHVRTLFSIEISSLNGKSLNIQEPTTNKFIALRIKSSKRDIKVNQIAVPPIKKEAEPPKKPANPFGFQSKPQPKEAEIDKKTVNDLKDLKIKDEKISPKKNQPVKTTKAAQGKSSIASFFAKPSTSSTPRVEKLAPEAARKVERVEIKKDAIHSEVKKRPHSNTSDSNEEVKSETEKKSKIQPKKKMKLEKKSASSRLMQICDSSSDEEGASNGKDVSMDTEEEPVVTKEKENKTPSPKKSDANRSSASSSSGKRRAKIKKFVTKTYEDEDGFINTVREVEEVSCSEEEPEIVDPPPKNVAQLTNSSTSTTAKKKISPPAGKKQGSILSFFGKK